MLHRIENVNKNYKIGKIMVNAIKNINLNIDGGNFYSLIGPSGSGKSTMLHMMGLLDDPSSGKIYFDNIDISTLSDNRKCEIRNNDIGFIFQKYYLIPVLNVYENIKMPLLQSKDIFLNIREKKK